MIDDKLQTPDGRAIPAATGDRAVAEYQHEEGIPVEMQSFIDACLALLPERPLSTGGRLGLFLFQLGAADRFWYSNGLDDRYFPAVAARLLQSLGRVAASEAAAISMALPQLRGVAQARAIIAEGAAVMDTWLDGHDPNIVLCLADMLPQWDDLSALLPRES